MVNTTALRSRLVKTAVLKNGGKGSHTVEWGNFAMPATFGLLLITPLWYCQRVFPTRSAEAAKRPKADLWVRDTTFVYAKCQLRMKIKLSFLFLIRALRIMQS